jgi:PTS system mannose-specific IIA component
MVSIIVVTLGDLSAGLVACTEHIVGKVSHVVPFAVDWKEGIDDAGRALGKLIKERDQGHGVLLLTDIYGATSTNIAQAHMKPGQIEVITGVNLPMVVSAFTLSGETSLGDAAAKLRDQGRKSIYVASERL